MEISTICNYDFKAGEHGIGIILSASENGSHTLYSNTVYNCYVGYSTGYKDTLAKNNIAQNCIDGFYGEWDDSSEYNISDLADDAPGDSSQHDVTFINESGYDFHLHPDDTEAKDAGTSLPAGFSDDPLQPTKPAKRRGQ